jgi:hypothetical protein
LRLGYGLSFYLISMAFRVGCNGLLAVHVLNAIQTWPCFGDLIALGQPQEGPSWSRRFEDVA